VSKKQTASEETRRKLLENGARNLRNFGYPDATAENILDVMIFRELFKAMLKDDENVNLSRAVEHAKEELLTEIEAKS